MTADDIGWSTPINGAGEHTGLNDAGIETFNNDPLAAAAHELPQNSHDASSKDAPVHLNVQRFRIPVADIPDVARLRDIVAKCSVGPDSKEKKVAAFFANAAKKLDGEEIDVLAFTDSNTTGLVGPCEEGKPFYALMKSRGSNVKANNQALGSFGIGKMAPYANSGLRTIFASTAYMEGDEVRRLVQGKTILTSHRDGQDIKDANSYWGVKQGFMPIDPDAVNASIPEWLTSPHANGDVGTTIFILDFNGSEDWEQAFIAYYLATFFAAIHEGTATAKIGGTDINSNTIGDLMIDDSLALAIENNETAAKSLKLAKACYSALTGEDAIDIAMNFDHFGPAVLSLAVGAKLPSKVSVIRHGMLITDQMDHLKRFPAMSEFAAVLRFERNDTNELLRQMEPPRHDCFEIKRLEQDIELHSRAKAGLKEAGEKVRAELISRLRGETQERVNVSELSDRLGETDNGARPKSSETNPMGRLVITNVARKLATQSRRKALPMPATSTGHTAGSTQVGAGTVKETVEIKKQAEYQQKPGESPAPAPVAEQHDGRSEAPSIESGPVFLEYALKTIRGVRDQSGAYKISFVAPVEALYGFKFEPVGYSKSDNALPVRSVTNGTHDSKGFVSVKATAGQKISFMVEFQDVSFNGPVKVVSHAV